MGLAHTDCLLHTTSLLHHDLESLGARWEAGEVGVRVRGGRMRLLRAAPLHNISNAIGKHSNCARLSRLQASSVT